MSAYPEGTKREDMLPGDALEECYRLYATGEWVWPDAWHHLVEVMGHVKRLQDASVLPETWWVHIDGEPCTAEVSQELPGMGICEHDRRVNLVYTKDGRAAR